MGTRGSLDREAHGLGGGLTPDELRIVAAVESGLKKLDEQVAGVFERLKSGRDTELEVYRPIPAGDWPGGDAFREPVSDPWSRKRTHGSLVMGFSEQRERILRAAKEGGDSSFIDAVFVNIIYATVGPDKRPSVGGPLPVVAPPKSDCFLFERGCFLLFLLDLWHINNALFVDRATVFYGAIVRMFVELFEQSLRTTGLQTVLLNRLECYSRVFRESGSGYSDRMRFYFTELAKRCTRKRPPVAYDFEPDKFPVMIADLGDEFGIAIDWSSTVAGMTEALCGMFAYRYNSGPGRM